MTRIFASMHARAICHATEELDRVERAIRSVVGDAELQVARTEGVHGNEIRVIQADVEEVAAIRAFFDRLSTEALREIQDSLDQRIDEERNLFLRVEKQPAMVGEIRLGTGDDVVSIRLRVIAYPAKKEVAVGVVRKYIEELIAGRPSGDGARNG